MAEPADGTVFWGSYELTEVAFGCRQLSFLSRGVHEAKLVASALLDCAVWRRWRLARVFDEAGVFPCVPHWGTDFAQFRCFPPKQAL